MCAPTMHGHMMLQEQTQNERKKQHNEKYLYDENVETAEKVNAKERLRNEFTEHIHTNRSTWAQKTHSGAAYEGSHRERVNRVK